MAMNPRLLRPKTAPGGATAHVLTESGNKLTTESGDKIVKE